MKSKTIAKAMIKKTAKRTFRSPPFDEEDNNVINLAMLLIVLASNKGIVELELETWHMTNFAVFRIQEKFLDLPVFTKNTLTSPRSTNAALAAFHEASFDCGLTSKLI